MVLPHLLPILAPRGASKNANAQALPGICVCGGQYSTHTPRGFPRATAENRWPGAP